MTAMGLVRVWHDADGWGVVDSPATPGGCWVHFSTVLVAGYTSLRQGQDVTFTFENAKQDGYSFRALAAWPSDQVTVEVVPYSPQWPRHFEQVAAGLRTALAKVPTAVIEHVGSTSVPGLAAKPILDIDVVVDGVGVSAAVAALTSVGYRHSGRCQGW